MNKIPGERAGAVRPSVQKVKPLLLSAWPLLALGLFACVAVTRWLPGGYARAVVAAPILLMVPGSLTQGAIFWPDQRPRGAAYICYSALLSVIWLSFASLALYLLGVLITADAMYWSLLVICAALATVAQARLGLRQPTASFSPAGSGESVHPDPLGLRPAAAPFYAIVAVAAGLSLLAGGVYLQAHLPHPARAGYTWIAWEHPQGTGEFTIGPAGAELPFEIFHRQAGATTYQLSAAWQGGPSGSLAKPMAVRLGPNQTFHAALFIPPLPIGCAYRVVITLIASRQHDPFTKKPQRWSINAGVHGQGKPRKTCT